MSHRLEPPLVSIEVEISLATYAALSITQLTHALQKGYSCWPCCSRFSPRRIARTCAGSVSIQVEQKRIESLRRCSMLISGQSFRACRKRCASATSPLSRTGSSMTIPILGHRTSVEKMRTAPGTLWSPSMDKAMRRTIGISDRVETKVIVSKRPRASSTLVAPNVSFAPTPLSDAIVHITCDWKCGLRTNAAHATDVGDCRHKADTASMQRRRAAKKGVRDITVPGDAV